MKKLSLLLAVLLIITACKSNATEDITESESTTVTSAEETTTTEETTSDTADTSEETTQTATSEETTATAAAPLDFVNAEAEALYNVIINNKSVWAQNEMADGTLIDLDFDGTPEFIVAGRGLAVFRINGDVMTEIDLHITSAHYSAFDHFSESRVIYPYTDEYGDKKWVIPYMNYGGNYDDGNDYREYFLSVFDFSDGEVKETPKFYGKFYGNDDYSREGYYGYPLLNYEVYIDGERFKASDDKTAAFYAELDKLCDECKALQDAGEETYGFLPWECVGYYPDPTATEWEAQKEAFLNSLLAKEPAYDLFPSLKGVELVLYSEGGFSHADNIPPSLNSLVNAYYGGDEDYFRTEETTYDNGGAMCKPVIYLYPTEPTDVSVRVTFPLGGDFTCTYPDYGDGWNVTAYPGGRIINKADGYEYSYLYWEGDGPANWDFSRGFVVKGSDTAAFLRDKLSYLGLTPREYNEFIVYWLPLMQGNDYNLITFQTQAYENCAKLQVSPKPDSVLRVFMAYKPLDKYIAVPEQKLTRFERNGFTVIEWGGTCVS